MRDIIEKFVGMNSDTRRRTITAFFVAVIDVLTVFQVIEFSDEQINAIKNIVLMVITAFVWAYCSHYKNNDYTKGAVIGTGITRQINSERDPNYVGERFYTNDAGELLDECGELEVEKVDGDTMLAEELEAEMAIEQEEKDN